MTGRSRRAAAATAAPLRCAGAVLCRPSLQGQKRVAAAASVPAGRPGPGLGPGASLSLRPGRLGGCRPPPPAPARRRAGDSIGLRVRVRLSESPTRAVTKPRHLVMARMRSAQPRPGRGPRRSWHCDSESAGPSRAAARRRPGPATALRVQRYPAGHCRPAAAPPPGPPAKDGCQWAP
jgi:hypothetical protein